jgi:Zn-dependent membrane protease YugP
MGLLDLVFVKLAPVSFMTLVAAILWITGTILHSNSLISDGYIVFFAGIILQIVYLLLRFRF